MSTTREYWAERKREERKRMRKCGFILRQMWVHPDDWPSVSAMVLSLRDGRKKSR